MSIKHSLIVAFFLIPFISNKLDAQVSVAPTVLMIDGKTNVANIQIQNSPDAAKEIRISMDFGYPGTDSIGNMPMIYGDLEMSKVYGLDPYLRVFPKTFVLQPGAQQIVRLQVKPMRDKEDGTYWTRLVIQSSNAAKDIETTEMTNGVGTQINYVFKQNVPVLYQKGNCETGLKILNCDVSQEENMINAILDIDLLGNSPFLGTVYTRILDKSGAEVHLQQKTLVLYFDGKRRIEIAKPEGLKPGDYTLEFVFETQRNDIPKDDLVQAQKLSYTIPVKL